MGDSMNPKDGLEILRKIFLVPLQGFEPRFFQPGRSFYSNYCNAHPYPVWIFNLIFWGVTIRGGRPGNRGSISGEGNIFLSSVASRSVLVASQHPVEPTPESFPGDNPARSWDWSFTSVYRRCEDWMRLYLHSSVYLRHDAQFIVKVTSPVSNQDCKS